MSRERPLALLVLGLGNLLVGDDGLGAVAVHLLERDYETPPGVRVLDGGTLGLALLSELASARTAILVDAIRADAPPGTLVRLEGDDVAPAVAHRLSPHQIGVADLLDGARLIGCCPPHLVLLGLVPQALELGLRRSPAVEAALPALVRSVAAEAAILGHVFTPRAGDAVADPDAGVLAAVYGL